MIEKKTSMLVAQSQRAKGVASVAEASGARALGASVLLIVVAVYVASPCICAGTRGGGAMYLGRPQCCPKVVHRV